MELSSTKATYTAGTIANRYRHDEARRVNVSRIFASTLVSLTAVGLAILLLYTFATFSTTVFSYYGYVWQPTWLTIGSGFALVAMVALYLPVQIVRPGDLAIYILFLLAYLPAIVIPPAFLRMPIKQVLAFQLVLSFCMLIIVGSNFIPRVRIDLGIFNHQWYLACLILTFVLLMIPVVFYLGIPSSIPTFAEVYEVRYESRVSMDNAPGFVAYFWSWLAKVINPFLLAYGIVERKKTAAILGIGGTLYLYALTGAKLLVFSMVMIVGVMLALRLLGRYMALILPSAMGILIVLSKIFDTVLSSTTFTSLLVNRPLVLPGILSGYYFEFFSANEPGRWGYTFLSFLYDYPYDLTPTFLIGESYFDSASTQANAHMWVDAFANFGFGGMLTVSFLAGALIWMLNCLSTGRSTLIIAGMTCVIAYSLASTSLFTSLLTNGTLITLAILLVSPTKFSAGELDITANSVVDKRGQ